MIGKFPHLALRNTENFRYVRKCAASLERREAGTDYTLVLRWHWSTAWCEWLSRWNGRFCYFPDYDPAGINIFLTEVLSLRPDAQLLVPQNLETMLREHGSRNLYLKQEKLLPLETQHAKSAELSRLMQSLRKALEHEALLT